jgi:hypothetical protein
VSFGVLGDLQQATGKTQGLQKPWGLAYRKVLATQLILSP